MLSLNEPITVSGQEYAPTLALLLWLHDESFSLLLVKLFFEILTVLRQNPRLWKEIIFVRHHILHILQILSQQIFPGKYVAGGKMVCPLIRFHLGKERWQNWAVNPPHVPILVVLGRQPEIGLLCAVL